MISFSFIIFGAKNLILNEYKDLHLRKLWNIKTALCAIVFYILLTNPLFMLNATYIRINLLVSNKYFTLQY